MMITATRTARPTLDDVRRAVALGVPRKPLPLACLWSRLALGWDGAGDEGSLAFADEGDRHPAMAELSWRLAEADPADWPGISAVWANDWGACWKPHAFAPRR